VIVNGTLVRRLEASAALETMHQTGRISSAAAAQFGDGALIAMGAGRYVNRAMAVTTLELSSADLDRIEQFYTARGLPPMIEVSSWAHAATVQQLAERRYAPLWFRAMFAIVTPPSSPDRDTVRIERVTDDAVTTWMAVLADGNQVSGDASRQVSDEFAAASRTSDSVDLLAFIDGRAVGCGSLQAIDGIGWLGGAATLPEYRGRGVQTALLRHRLQLATALSCELVAATAIPSGASARNMHRLGFTHVQTQLVMSKPATSS
jgi:GNAT superfamily N-acetyltransferase